MKLPLADSRSSATRVAPTAREILDAPYKPVSLLSVAASASEELM
jgi:hypothetical protein